MNLSQTGLDLIKSFEGLKLKSYKALPTEIYYTIGYGHYGRDVSPKMEITREQAEEILRKDLAGYIKTVNDCVKVPLNQNQFDSLVSLCYNIGITGFKTSSLVKRLNKGDYHGASAEFDLWIHQGGKVIAGLVNRRNKEQALFNKALPVIGIQSVGKIKVNLVKNFTYIYEKTSDTSKAIGKADKNSVYSIAGSVTGWYEIIYNGKRAYIKAKYCTRI